MFSIDAFCFHESATNSGERDMSWSELFQAF